MATALQKIKSFLASYGAIAVGDIFALAVIFFCGGVLIMDELEHLHAAYFVSTGLVPFRDFFEHHNPLFWYMLATLVKFMPQNAVLLLFAARFLMSLFSAGTVYYIWKTADRFFGGKTCALLTVLIFASFYPALYMFSIVKPDVPMHFFFACGSYYFFEYVKTLKFKPLAVCAAAFTMAFLFLQTAVFLIFPFALICLYILYKHPAQIKNFLPAAVIPLFLLGLFALYLFLSGSFTDYIQSCWIFNTKFFSLLDFKLPSVLPNFLVYIILGYIAYGYLIRQRKEDIFVNIAALALTCGLLKNIICTAYYPRYLLPCFLYSSMLGAAALADAKPQMQNLLKTALAAILVINIILSLIYNNHLSLALLRQIKPLEATFRYFGDEENMYQSGTSYYWDNPPLDAVHNYLFDKDPEYDVSNLIKKQKFKYIIYNQTVARRKRPVPAPGTNERLKEIYRKHNAADKSVFDDYEYVPVGNIGLYKLKEPD